MATAFSYSGTGLESAIQSGSGGIGTGSSITLEVDAVPSDVSQGDTVKVALGSASDWSGGNGETAYGDIGGAGANGGTNITLTDRGQEGTSAASWSEGDPVRVGVQGRDEANASTSAGGSVITGAPNGVPIPAVATTQQASDISQGRTGWVPFTLRTPLTLDSLSIEVTTAGSSPGTIDVRIFLPKENGMPRGTELVQVATSWGADTSGLKTKNVGVGLDSGDYWIGHTFSNWGTVPDVKAVTPFQNIDPHRPSISHKDDSLPSIGFGDVNGIGASSSNIIAADNNEGLYYIAQFS
jgi:hypothetical protein